MITELILILEHVFILSRASSLFGQCLAILICGVLRFQLRHFDNAFI